MPDSRRDAYQGPNPDAAPRRGGARVTDARRAATGLLLLAALPGLARCAAPSQAPRRRPYAFHQSLIGGSTAPSTRGANAWHPAAERSLVRRPPPARPPAARTPAARTAAPWRRRLVARAAATVGRRLAAEDALTARAWVAETLGRPTTALPSWSALNPRRDGCQPGDLVVFDEGARSDAAPGTVGLGGVDGEGVTSPHSTPLGATSARRVGIVLGCSGSRAEFVFVSGTRLRRGRLDQADPHRRRDRSGAVINSFVRIRRPSDGPGSFYLAGALLAGYATLEP